MAAADERERCGDENDSANAAHRAWFCPARVENPLTNETARPPAPQHRGSALQRGGERRAAARASRSRRRAAARRIRMRDRGGQRRQHRRDRRRGSPRDGTPAPRRAGQPLAQLRPPARGDGGTRDRRRRGGRADGRRPARSAGADRDLRAKVAAGLRRGLCRAAVAPRRKLVQNIHRARVLSHHHAADEDLDPARHRRLPPDEPARRRGAAPLARAPSVSCAAW